MKSSSLSNRDSFGRLLIDFSELIWEERLAELPRVIGRCLAGSMTVADQRWIGHGLAAYRQRGIPLEQALSLVPPQSCTLSVHAHYIRVERDRLLIAFAQVVGTDREALRVLRGELACPARALEALEALKRHASDIPTGPNAISRARGRLHRLVG